MKLEELRFGQRVAVMATTDDTCRRGCVMDSVWVRYPAGRKSAILTLVELDDGFWSADLRTHVSVLAVHPDNLEPLVELGGAP